MKKVLSTILLVSMLTITACSSPAATTTAGAAAAAKTESVTVKGYGGDVVVKVTATKEKIEKVEIEGKDETPALGGEAIKELSKKIVDGNTIKVDAHSGASVTSKAIVKAVEEAITKMGYDVASFKK